MCIGIWKLQHRLLLLLQNYTAGCCCPASEKTGAHLVHGVIKVCILLPAGWVLEVGPQRAVGLCKEDSGDVAAIWSKGLLHPLYRNNDIQEQ